MNGLARLLVVAAGLSLPTHALDPSGNGVSDIFEAYYELSGTDPSNSDGDGDGLSLLDEFMVGANPLVRDGWQAVEFQFGPSPDGLAAVIDFRPAAGLRYRIRTTPTLDGGWTPRDEVLGAGTGESFRYPVNGPRGFFQLTTLGPDADADGDGLDSREEFLLGTPPDNPDQDGDSLNDAGEFLAKADANDPDSDDDGLPDGYEARTPYANASEPGTHLLAAPEYFENFESLTDGLLGGQDGWVVSSEKQAIVQSGTAATGLKAIQLTALDQPAVAEKYFDGASLTEVWIDLQMLPGATGSEPAVLGTAAATAIHFTDTGHLKAFDGTSRSWIEDSFASGVGANTWRRLTFRLDYPNQRWLVYLNGKLVNPAPGGMPGWFGFSNASPFFYRIAFSAQGSGNELYVDDILVSTSQPDGLDITP